LGAPLNPFRRVRTSLDILAPGIVQNHLTVGASWTLVGGTGLSGSVTYAPPTIVDGSNSVSAPFGGCEANIHLSEVLVTLPVGWHL
jgi:long-chain fatty acid transport protein